MTAGSSNLRGIIYMVLASGCFTINNGLLKAAVVHLPPLEALFLRAVAAVILGMPVLLLTAPAGSLRHMLDGRVLRGTSSSAPRPSPSSSRLRTRRWPISPRCCS